MYGPNADVQRATHPRLHLRDARDAHTVFEAVRQGFLGRITRRLNEMERATHVQSGAVFVWEECDDDSGLKRWTDGRFWGQSRMREPYLFYDEKITSTGASGQSRPSSYPSLRFVDGISRGSQSSSALTHQDRSGGQHTGLVKQAYSAWVVLSPNSPPRKWHVTAYFRYADLDALPTVDLDPLLCTIIIPRGIYRGGKARTKEDDYDATGQQSVSGVPGMHSTSSHPNFGLPPLHSTVGPYADSASQLKLHTKGHHPPRFTEDQRVIQILNSRYVL